MVLCYNENSYKKYKLKWIYVVDNLAKSEFDWFMYEDKLGIVVPLEYSTGNIV